MATGGELECAGVSSVTALPDGSIASGAEMVNACSALLPGADALVLFNPTSGSCRVATGFSDAAPVTADDPVIVLAAIEAATAAECLARRAVVFADSLSGVVYCLPWPSCSAIFAADFESGGCHQWSAWTGLQ